MTAQVDRPSSATAQTAVTSGLMLTAAQALTLLGVTSDELASLAATGLLRPRGPDVPGARRYPVRQVEAVLNRRGGIPRDARPGLLQALARALAARAGPGPGCQPCYHGQHPHLLIGPAGGVQLTVWAVPTSQGWRYWWGQERSHLAANPAAAATAIAADLTPASPASGLSPDRDAQRQHPAAQPATHAPHHQLPDGGAPSRRDAAVITAYKSGLTIQQCAHRFRSSNDTILGILGRHRVPTRTRGKPMNLAPAIEQALVAAYRAGLSMQQCADWFGISSGKVARILQRREVPIRPGGSRSDLDPAQVTGVPRQPKQPSRAGGHTKMLAPALELAVIAAYRDQGLSMQQCAIRFDISRATVTRTLRRHEVPTRAKGGHHGPGQAGGPGA